MRILIVEDDIISRFLLTEYMSAYGTCYTAVDGEEAVDAVRKALENREPFDVICLDIKMPKKDGQEALRDIRELEEAKGIMLGDGAKIVMTTTMSDADSIMEAFRQQCDAYLVKPISKEKMEKELQKLGMHAQDDA